MKKLLIGLLFVPLMAHAEFKTGNQLYTDITSDSVVNQMVALGYIMGIADITRGKAQCGPASATAGQLMDMVKKHLQDFPNMRHYTADIIIMYVLGQAWPCKNSNGKPI